MWQQTFWLVTKFVKIQNQFFRETMWTAEQPKFGKLYLKN